MTESKSDYFVDDPSDYEYLIDKVMPCREIHLIAGPVGSSKTTLTLQILQKWQNGEDVFGRKSFPVPFAYVACERTVASTRRTLRRCKVNLRCPIISLLERKDWPKGRKLDCLIHYLKQNHPSIRFIFIDGFQTLTPDGKVNDYNTVAEFLTTCSYICQSNNLTILGSAHAAKTKENERYENPRQQILGSVAWGGFSETAIILQPADPTDPQSARDIQILPRNDAQIHLQAELVDDGLLEFQAPQAKIPTKKTPEECHTAITSALQDFVPGEEFKLAALIERSGVSKTVVYAAIPDLTLQGLIESPSRGIFRRTNPS